MHDSFLMHRLIKITDRTLNVVFSSFGWNSFTITLRQKPREVSRSLRRTGSLCPVILRRLRRTGSLCPVILRRLRETSQGFCLRVILNDFYPNLEKMTFSVLSVIFINLWINVHLPLWGAYLEHFSRDFIFCRSYRLLFFNPRNAKHPIQPKQRT